MQQYLIMEGLNSEVWRYQREVIWSRKSKKNRQHNGQKKEDKQRSTKYYTKEKGQYNSQEKKSKITNNELLWYTVK